MLATACWRCTPGATASDPGRGWCGGSLPKALIAGLVLEEYVLIYVLDQSFSESWRLRHLVGVEDDAEGAGEGGNQNGNLFAVRGCSGWAATSRDQSMMIVLLWTRRSRSPWR